MDRLRGKRGQGIEGGSLILQVLKAGCHTQPHNRAQYTLLVAVLMSAAPFTGNAHQGITPCAPLRTCTPCLFHRLLPSPLLSPPCRRVCGVHRAGMAQQELWPGVCVLGAGCWVCAHMLVLFWPLPAAGPALKAAAPCASVPAHLVVVSVVAISAHNTTQTLAPCPHSLAHPPHSLSRSLRSPLTLPPLNPTPPP